MISGDTIPINFRLFREKFGGHLTYFQSSGVQCTPYPTFLDRIYKIKTDILFFVLIRVCSWLILTLIGGPRPTLHGGYLETPYIFFIEFLNK